MSADKFRFRQLSCHDIFLTSRWPRHAVTTPQWLAVAQTSRLSTCTKPWQPKVAITSDWIRGRLGSRGSIRLPCASFPPALCSAMAMAGNVSSLLLRGSAQSCVAVSLMCLCHPPTDRKSMHVYAPPFAQLVESPTSFAGSPMQIDSKSGFISVRHS